MAAPMKEELGGAVAASTDSVESCNGNNNNSSSNANFEYDDNEWDIGIGDLIIDLDADIEKTGSTSSTTTTGDTLSITNSGTLTVGVSAGGGAMSGAAATAPTANTAGSNKTNVEHSATVDKGLKMKIKRTKTGTKSFEAKHEIVKPGEQNGSAASAQSQSSGSASSNDSSGSSIESKQNNKHATTSNASSSTLTNNTPSTASSVKRGSSSHRRDKVKDKQHGLSSSVEKCHKGNSSLTSELNGRNTVAQSTSRTNAFPTMTSNIQTSNVPNSGSQVGESGTSTINVTTNGSEQNKSPSVNSSENPLNISKSSSFMSVVTKPLQSTSPPPANKVKSSNCSTSVSTIEHKETADACVGTSISIGTVTEPDCFGPCEPGTHVNLEGIVWNEIEGVLVVNVTWRGKTYIGTLLDCTRHDWAPPRFSEASAGEPECRLPQKGRGKRGRASLTASPSNDLVNFTETRSSVHSKLRSNGTNKCNTTNNSNRRGTSSPTPTSFAPPRSESTGSNKRKKPLSSEDETSGKKIKAEPASPPPMSPTMLECPDPNCSKKYKNANGLRYHQSHAHGAALDDEDGDTKESGGASYSENEDDISPAPMSSLNVPEIQKEEQTVINNVEQSPSSTTPPAIESDPPAPLQSPPLLVPKPSVLRFSLSTNEETSTSTPISTTPKTVLSVPVVQPSPTPPPLLQPATPIQNIAPTSQSPQPQPPILHVQSPASQQLPPQVQPLALNQPQVQKVPQFKVKPASALMPMEDNLKGNKDTKNKVSSTHKKKNRKSPASSPRPFPIDQPQFENTNCGREDVQSPAYSDISDDTAPILEVEMNDSINKPKLLPGDKKTDQNTALSPHSIQPYNMYSSYYSQPPYLISSMQSNDTSKQMKETDKTNSQSQDLKLPNTGDKDNKKDISSNQASDYQQQKLLQQYFTYDAFVQNYPYNIGSGYPMSMVQDKDLNKDEKNHQSSIAGSLNVPQTNKIKSEQVNPKDKSHQNENHQIMKESIEMKSQMNSAYMFSRQQQQQQQQDDARRYYGYPDQRRKEHSSSEHAHNKPSTQTTPTKHSTPLNTAHKHKDKHDDKKDDKLNKSSHLSEGVKPTMETQGPPPPPTSYAYIHPGFMQSPHFAGALAFDPMYRSAINPMLVPGPYGNTPPPSYLHPQIHAQMQRYHAPEDLSRPAASTQSTNSTQSPSGPKAALDLLQHHASQYYSSHKIHELQERAIKSPTPKSNPPPGLPPAPSPGTRQSPSLSTTGVTLSASERSTSAGPPPASQSSSKPGSTGDPKDCRSPPPQRHVHTHHHTHVGLGYPLYPAPYTGKPL